MVDKVKQHRQSNPRKYYWKFGIDVEHSMCAICPTTNDARHVILTKKHLDCGATKRINSDEMTRRIVNKLLNRKQEEENQENENENKNKNKNNNIKLNVPQLITWLRGEEEEEEDDMRDALLVNSVDGISMTTKITVMPGGLPHGEIIIVRLQSPSLKVCSVV